MTSAITQSTDPKTLPFSYPLEMTTSDYPVEEAIGLTYPYILKHCNRVRRSQIFSDDESDDTDCTRWEPGYSPGYASLSSVLKRVKRQRQESLNSETRELSDVYIPSKKPWIQIFLNLISRRSTKVSISETVEELSPQLPKKTVKELPPQLPKGTVEELLPQLMKNTVEEIPPQLPQENKDSAEIIESRFKAKVWSSLAKLSLPKIPERSWWCKSCRRPRDRCQCICNIF